MLTLDGIDAYYGDLQALYEVSLQVEQGRVFALVGANAAGKSTTLRVISGLVTPRRGRVVLDGQDLTRVPAHQRVDLGIVQVPEGRRLFPFMTVAENLLLGAHTPRARAARDETLRYVYAMFPVLEERQSQLAGIIDLVRRVHAEGVTLIVIEHIMAAMMRLAQRIVMLHHG